MLLSIEIDMVCCGLLTIELILNISKDVKQ